MRRRCWFATPWPGRLAFSPCNRARGSAGRIPRIGRWPTRSDGCMDRHRHEREGPGADAALVVVVQGQARSDAVVDDLGGAGVLFDDSGDACPPVWWPCGLTLPHRTGCRDRGALAPPCGRRRHDRRRGRPVFVGRDRTGVGSASGRQSAPVCGYSRPSSSRVSVDSKPDPHRRGCEDRGVGLHRSGRTSRRAIRRCASSGGVSRCPAGYPSARQSGPCG